MLKDSTGWFQHCGCDTWTPTVQSQKGTPVVHFSLT